ncbi:MAG TPA: hypothetical protein VEK08_24855 [Planctomycetota bacterium]|nr:hypothetical protein [Planctomycetota bacterium]
MSEVIISCAGCGKRFKGTPGAKKFKCSGCSNVFTFPEAPRTPAAGKILCSNCWVEIDFHEQLCNCPTCAQKVSPAYGGKAQLWAAGSSLAPSINSEEHPKMTTAAPDLESKVTELRAQLASAEAAYAQLQKEMAALREEHDRHVEQLREDVKTAHAEADQRNQQWVATRTELDQYKAMAVATLEPLSLEYTRRMRDLISETDKLRTSIKEVRNDFSQRLQTLDNSTCEIREKLNGTCREINERLAEVLGVEPDRGEVIANPVEQLPSGPLSELLVAGALAGAPIIVTKHPKNV